MQFQIYRLRDTNSSPLGSVTVTTVKANRSSAICNPGPFLCPDPCFAFRSERLIGDRLKLHIAATLENEEEQNFIKELQASIGTTTDFVSSSSQADIVLELVQGKNRRPDDTRRRISLSVTSPIVTLHTSPATAYPINHTFSLRLPTVVSVLDAAHKFFACMRLTSPKANISARLKVGFYHVREVKGDGATGVSMDGDQLGITFEADGDNLIDLGGTVRFQNDDKAMCGITIDNDTDKDLYAYVFYCDTSDFTIGET
jgi:hypothetical protein